jgi:AAA15 family ATPase/GTPase
MDNKKLAVLWDNINIYPQLRQEVFNALQLIDNEIQEVVLVGREKNITPILIYRNSDERIPLKSLGDGIIHLFYIILGLVNARGGVILIDEFENGLHYTAHEKVWNLVFELSEKLNVQVFATTHSYDCIRAFQEVAQKHHTEGMLFHLGRSALKSDHEKILATAYDKEELRLADLAKLEVR